jgi:hypothetical protein
MVAGQWQTGHWWMNSGVEMDVLLIGQHHTLQNWFHLKQIKARRSNFKGSLQ